MKQDVVWLKNNLVLLFLRKLEFDYPQNTSHTSNWKLGNKKGRSSYPNPVGKTFVPSKAFIALDFPLLVRPKNTTFSSLRPTTSLMIATLDRWSEIL